MWWLRSEFLTHCKHKCKKMWGQLAAQPGVDADGISEVWSEVKEGSEGKENILDFTAKLLKTALELEEDEDLGIERAHRLLAPTLSNSYISTSVVVIVVNFQTKQQIVNKGWSTKDLQLLILKGITTLTSQHIWTSFSPCVRPILEIIYE